MQHAGVRSDIQSKRIVLRLLPFLAVDSRVALPSASRSHYLVPLVLVLLPLLTEDALSPSSGGGYCRCVCYLSKGCWHRLCVARKILIIPNRCFNPRPALVSSLQTVCVLPLLLGPSNAITRSTRASKHIASIIIHASLSSHDVCQTRLPLSSL